MEENSTRTVRQRRASKPKVKTGCNNCKSRRVKCDETRPQCNRCVKSGRICEGYPAYNPRNRSADITVPILPRPPQNGASNSASSSSYSFGTTPVPLAPAGSPNPESSLFTSRTLVRKPARQPRRSVARQAINGPISLTSYRPSVGIAFSTQENLYFQLFREHTASELSGFFNSTFWTRDVLQVSHSEASIRHAVVALGALYKTLEKSCESPPGSPDNGTIVRDTATDHFKFALQQYGKSLAQLRESLASKEVRSQRTILMSIVLFTCFSSFTGDHQAAIFQIQSGLSLLDERRQNQIQAFDDRNDPVEDELIQMFTRLAIQAKSYDMAFHFPAPYVIRLSPNSVPSSPQSPPSPSDSTSTSASADATIPEHFSSVQEARLSLDLLVERILRYQEALTSFYTAPDKIIPSQLRSSGIGYRAQLEQWSTAFKPILERRRALGVSNTERAGIIVLRMSYLNAWILFVMGFSTSELDFDKFMPEFREVVDLAREIVVDEELSLAMKKCGNHPNCHHRQNSQQHNHFYGAQTNYMDGHDYDHIKASFALDLGIVPSLFVVGTKCRDRRLRREAIKLLFSSPRREGMWDSILSGYAAEWIMHNEEDQLAPYSAESAGQVVPEDKRVMVKEILFDLQKREATLRCGTRGKAGEVDTRARETTIYW